jgi:hypothetical protein
MIQADILEFKYVSSIYHIKISVNIICTGLNNQTQHITPQRETTPDVTYLSEWDSSLACLVSE